MLSYLIFIALGSVNSVTVPSDTYSTQDEECCTTLPYTSDAFDRATEEGPRRTSDAFPFMTSILHSDNHLLGAGVIVGKRWIIVTAFQMGAFKAEQLKVRVGSQSAIEGGQLINVQQIFSHPMFRQYNNDVALLKTADQIVLGPAAQTLPIITTLPDMGSQATLVIWNEKHQTEGHEVNVVSISECRMFYPHFELTASNICIVKEHPLPFRVALYGSPVVYNGSLVGLYMGEEANNTFKPFLCSSLNAVIRWVEMMMTHEDDIQRLFPLS